MRSYLDKIHGSIRLRRPVIPPIQRLRDFHLMDEITASGQFPARDLGCINACRRFLQVTTVADISTISGDYILPGILAGTTTPDPMHHNHEFFNQQRPGYSAWRLWRKALRLFSYHSGRLHRPLGPWNSHLPRYRRRYPFLYHSNTHTLYSLHADNHYRALMPHSLPRHYHSLTNSPPLEPVGTIPVTPTIIGSFYCIPHDYAPDPPLPAPNITFEDHIRQLPAWSKTLLSSTTCTLDIHALTELLGSRHVAIASDGSVEDTDLERATFGFVITDGRKNRIVRGRGPVPGWLISSFRAEAYGILALLCWLHELQNFTGMKFQCIFHHYVDNTSILRRIYRLRRRKYHTVNSTLLPDWDVVSQILDTLTHLPDNYRFSWVKGHQDRHTPYDKLSLQAQLNVDSDRLAAAHYTDYPTPIRTVPIFPTVNAQMQLSANTITGHYASRIRYAYSSPALYKYMSTRFHWSDDILADIDWGHFNRIISKYYDRRVTIIKHLHSISPTGHIANRNDRHLPAYCSNCPCLLEDNNHVIICPCPSRRQWRSDTIRHLVNTLELPERHTDPILIDILRDGIIRYHQSDPDPPPLAAYPERYHPLIISQTAIGWNQLYMGRWSIHWRKLQFAHLTLHDAHTSKCNSRTWLTTAAHCLLDQWLKLWQTRNETRHGVDKAAQRTTRLHIVHNQLRELYLLRSLVRPCDRALFHADLNTHLAAHPALAILENWVAMYWDPIHASVRRAQELGIARVNSIRNWLIGGQEE